MKWLLTTVAYSIDLANDTFFSSLHKYILHSLFLKRQKAAQQQQDSLWQDNKANEMVGEDFHGS